MVRRLVIFVLVMVVLAGCVNGPVGPNITDQQGTAQDLRRLLQTESPSGQTNAPTQTAPPSGMTDKPPETATPSGMTDKPPETATPSGMTDKPPETATPSGEPNDPPETESPTDNDHTESPSAEKPNTPPSTETETPNNPWGERTLTVAIDNELDNDRQFQPLVADALAYWEQNSKQYAGYPIEYTLTDSAENADVIISFASSIDDCEGISRVAGCAPYITAADDVSRPAEVEIKGGYTDDSTRQLLIHELGHTLGLNHGDRPKQIMAAESDLTELPQPNVTERALPWDHSTLTVAVDLSTIPIHNRSAVNEQINTALDYYDRGAGGTVPEQVSFKRVSNPKNADIFITFSDTSPCDITSGSCSETTGINQDEDDALEQYVRLKITLTDLDTNTVAWHVGNRLGADGFGFDHPTDFPPPLRGYTPVETRKSQWWE